jgi:hypothetical protein
MCRDLELLNEIRPGLKPPSSRKAQVRLGSMDVAVTRAIRTWRDVVFEREHGHEAFSPDGLSTDDLIDRLASVGPIVSS